MEFLQLFPTRYTDILRKTSKATVEAKFRESKAIGFIIGCLADLRMHFWGFFGKFSEFLSVSRENGQLSESTNKFLCCKGSQLFSLSCRGSSLHTIKTLGFSNTRNPKSSAVFKKPFYGLYMDYNDVVEPIFIF